jgi:hypothetical protein
MTALTCRGCGSDDVTPVLDLDPLPVAGAGVFPESSLALSVLRAPQRLSFCGSCGLVFNRVFDPALLQTDTSECTSQAASAVFRTYATGVAREWVDTLELGGSTGCEIGSGDGWFAQCLLELGVARMRLVDPRADIDDVPDHLRSRVDVVPGLFRVEDLPERARFVCLRHTLEHLPRPDEFLGLVATAMRRAATTYFVGEVPALERILAIGAFWDLQYEHCSYFARPVLEGTLARAGFPGGRTQLRYDDQYLTWRASLDRQDGGDGLHPISQDVLDDLRGRVRAFATNVREQLAHWKAWLAAADAKGDEVVVWGGGAKGSTFVNLLASPTIRRVVDVNPQLQGGFLGGGGQPIVGPADLRLDPPRLVLLMNSVYTSEVEGLLRDLSLDSVEVVPIDG